MKISFFKKQSPEQVFQETLKKYQTAAADNPNDIRVHVKIAELYLEHDRKEEAIDEYLIAARAYQEKRLLQIAVAIYTHALSIARDRVELYTELANLHLRNGFIGDGVSVLERLAEYYNGGGHEYEATQVLKKIKEIDPNNKFIKTKVANFIDRKDLDKEAINKLYEIIGNNPGSIAVELKIKNGEKNKVEKSYNFPSNFGINLNDNFFVQLKSKFDELITWEMPPDIK